MKKKDITKRAFLSLMLTIFLVEITIQATSFIQGIFIGQYLDTEEFSAYGLAANYVNFQYIIGSMFAAGTQITVATFLSKGKKKEAQGSFFISLITVISISVLVIIIVNIFADDICIFFGTRESAAYLLPQASEYLRLIVLGTPAYCLSLVLPQVALLQGGHKFVYSSYATMLLLTFAGCFINFELMKGGLKGLGIIYSLNYYISVGILAIHFLNKNNTFNLMPKKLRFSLLRPVIQQAMPDMTLGICLLIFPILMNGLILNFDQSVHGLAAFSMQMNFRNFITTLSTGICTSVLILFGMYSSQYDFKECRKVLNCAIKILVVGILPISILIGVFSSDIAYIYTQNEETFEFTKIAIFWVAIYLPFFSIFRICVKILQGLKHNASPIVLNILGYLVFPVAIGMILSYMYGIVGILMALSVAQVIQCIFSLVALYTDKLFHRGKEDLDFPTCLLTKDNPVLFINHGNKENAEKVYDEIVDFCRNNKIHEHTIKRILLIIEEAIYLISSYQKNDIKKRLDCKIIINNDTVLIRFRDNFPKMMTKTLWKETVGINLYDIEDNYRKTLALKLIFTIPYDIEHEYIINFNNYLYTLHNLDQETFEENLRKYQLNLQSSSVVNPN